MAEFNASLFNTALFGGLSVPGGQVVQVGPGLLYPALRKAGVTIGPGRTPSLAQFQDAIDELNRLVGSLNCDRLFIYSIARAEFPLDPPQPVYTIGESADPFVTADLPAPRPQLIDSANIIQNQIRYPLALVDAQQWASMAQPMVQNSIPEILYNDRAFPLSSLYFWGSPMSGQTLELFAWQQVPQFLTITDVVLLPKQYEDALVLNLALRLAPHFQRPTDPNLREDARVSLMRLMSINAPKPVAGTSALGCGCYYDGYSDTYR